MPECCSMLCSAQCTVARGRRVCARGRAVKWLRRCAKHRFKWTASALRERRSSGETSGDQWFENESKASRKLNLLVLMIGSDRKWTNCNQEALHIVVAAAARCLRARSRRVSPELERRAAAAARRQVSSSSAAHLLISPLPNKQNSSHATLLCLCCVSENTGAVLCCACKLEKNSSLHAAYLRVWRESMSPDWILASWVQLFEIEISIGIWNKSICTSFRVCNRWLLWHFRN